MSTSPSLPTVPRTNNPEYPSARWRRTVRSRARLGLNNGRSPRSSSIGASLCLLTAEWADVALAILERRAAEQQCARLAASEQPDNCPGNGHRSPEAAR